MGGRQRGGMLGGEGGGWWEIQKGEVIGGRLVGGR